MPLKPSKRDLVQRLDRLRRRMAAQLQPDLALATAQDKARRAETRLREALDALPEGIVFLDRDGRYVSWNKKYAEIYHRSADLFREGVKLADTLRIGVGRGDYPDAVGREEEWLAERW
jgi:PAS domain-containing protein